jgi:hypothetical protein
MIKKINDPAKCPNCGRISHGILQILYFFGLRKMKYTIRVQSWCIPCRSTALRSVRNEM